jgi:hypothetical protein
VSFADFFFNFFFFVLTATLFKAATEKLAHTVFMRRFADLSTTAS